MATGLELSQYISGRRQETKWNTISVNLKHMHIKQDLFNHGMSMRGKEVEIRVVERSPQQIWNAPMVTVGASLPGI